MQFIKDNYAISLTDKDFAKGSLKQQSNIRPNRIFIADSHIDLYKVGSLETEKLNTERNRRGSQAEYNELLNKFGASSGIIVTSKDIVYIGEFHQVPEILSFQMDMASELISKGFRPSIGLEMFNVLQQKILDYYILGIMSFEQMLSLYEMGPEGFGLNHYNRYY